MCGDYMRDSHEWTLDLWRFTGGWMGMSCDGPAGLGEPQEVMRARRFDSL